MNSEPLLALDDGLHWWEKPQIASPRPWHISGASNNPGEAEVIVDAQGETVCWIANTQVDQPQPPADLKSTPGALTAGDFEVISPQNRANARAVVRSVNHYPALSAFLEDAIRSVGSLEREQRIALGLESLFTKALELLDSTTTDPLPVVAPQPKRWLTLR